MTAPLLSIPAVPTVLAWGILLGTAAVLGLLIPLALHRTLLVLRALRKSTVCGGAGEVEGRGDRDSPLPGEWPAVTVQLPIFNESRVAARLVDAVCSLDYPLDRLEVQVLDDSTDETVTIVRERAAHWRARGVAIHHLRRNDRDGFKAGALAQGLESARGDFLLIMDADFIPGPRLVRELLPPFRDPTVGMVQARWDHLNEADGPLTRAQALLLDAHFAYEQGGRQAAGCFFNFNGTAGIWRREAVVGAGGWSADTLTEDLDLSYRAQLAGWRFVYLDAVRVPAELPTGVGALEGQQRRWAQGGMQTALKLLPRVFRAPLPLKIKIEASIHLGGHLAHPLTLLLGLLLLPSAVARVSLGLERWLVLDLFAFAAATVPFVIFYSLAGLTRSRSPRDILRGVPAAFAVGIGLTASVSRAVVRGLGRTRDPFERTPKTGVAPGGRDSPARHALGSADRPLPPSSTRGFLAGSRSRPGDSRLKGFLTLYHAAGVGLAAAFGFVGTLPFLILFASGYGGLWWGGRTGSLVPAAPRGNEIGRSTVHA